MDQHHRRNNRSLSIPVPGYRFDQKNEMFKRNFWDQTVQLEGKRYWENVQYQEKAGFTRVDYAFRDASWDLEHKYANGNGRSNSGLYSWESLPSKAELEKRAPEDMARIVKKAARFYGADLVGVCKVHPNWIYSHEYNMFTGEHYPLELPEGCNTAIVMAVAMDYEGIRASPTGVAGGATGLGYSKMAFTSLLVAGFIRKMGYQAAPCGNDTALSIPMAAAAGLGEYSRMGLLITAKYGPRVRLCKVFTDLPLRSDSYRPFGVVEFCRTCMKCARNCPSGAIPSGGMTTEGPNVSSHSGILKWYVDAEKCYAFWEKNRMDCTTCIRVCPFNKKPGVLHGTVRGVIRKTSSFNRFFSRMDDLFGYGAKKSAEKFWK